MNSEDRALKEALSGKIPEKRIMVGYKGKKKKQGDIKSKLTDIMAEVRMPWFCPACDKIMKKRLDNKFWRLFNHCFDCQLAIEHEMRVNGTFETYEKKRFFENRKAAILDQIQSIENWKNQGDMEIVEPVNVNTGFVHIDRYEIPKELVAEADEALAELSVTLVNVDAKLDELYAD